jgi:serine/threonine protein kinase
MLPKSRKIITNFFEKEWFIPQVERIPILNRRIRLIEKCTALALQSIPQITHSWQSEVLRQRMPLFIPKSLSGLTKEHIKNHLLCLANDIEVFHHMGLIHGDIHPKNLIYTGSDLILVDFEPIIEYSQGNLRFYCSTPPWLAHEDLKNKKLSFMTDRIGFMHTAMKLLKIDIPKFNINATQTARQRSDYPIGGLISDEYVRNLTCNEIVEKILGIEVY